MNRQTFAFPVPSISTSAMIYVPEAGITCPSAGGVLQESLAQILA